MEFIFVMYTLLIAHTILGIFNGYALKLIVIFGKYKRSFQLSCDMISMSNSSEFNLNVASKHIVNRLI